MIRHIKSRSVDVAGERYVDDIQFLFSLPTSEREAHMSSLTGIALKLPFFKNLVKDYSILVVSECLKVFRYEHYPPHSFIFKQGDKGTKFYILILGMAKVFQYDASDSMISMRGYTGINILKPGDCFGERASLLGLPRIASIYTDSDCHLLCMDYDHYASLLRDTFVKEFGDLVRLLKAVPTLQHQSESNLKKACYFFRKLHINKNTYLYKEGEKARSAFLVYSGEFKMIKKVVLHVGTNRKFSSHSYLREKYMKKYFEVALLGSNELIGDEDILKKISERSTSCLCVQDSIVYEITKYDYKRIILQEVYNESVKQNAVNRLEHRSLKISREKELYKFFKPYHHGLLQISSASTSNLVKSRNTLTPQYAKNRSEISFSPAKAELMSNRLQRSKAFRQLSFKLSKKVV